MSCISNPDIVEHLRADTKNFIGTRWTWVQPVICNEGAFYNEHVVHCTYAQGNSLHLSTVYSDPFHHFVVPVEEFFSPTGAFTYIGIARDLSWVTSEAYFEHHGTLYRIDGIEGKYIRCTAEWRMLEERSLRIAPEEGPMNVRYANVNMVYDGQYLSRMTRVGLETMQVLLQELTAQAERNSPLRNVGVDMRGVAPAEEVKEVVGAERYDRLDSVG